MIGSMAVTESEWSRDDVAQMLASIIAERELDPNGFPISEVTDPANRYAFEGREVPIVNYAEKARRDAEDAYYKKWDRKDNPVNRNGHMWEVKRKS